MPRQLKPLFSRLEDAVTYQGHSEICGCHLGDEHKREWIIHVEMLESEVSAFMDLLSTYTRMMNRVRRP